MPHLIIALLVAAAASVLSTPAAYADLGDQLFKLLPDDGAAGDFFGSCGRDDSSSSEHTP